MEDGTAFHFVTDGIHAALKRATEAACGRDIRLGSRDDPALNIVLNGTSTLTGLAEIISAARLSTFSPRLPA
jgi:hypothetical protein